MCYTYKFKDESDNSAYISPLIFSITFSTYSFSIYNLFFRSETGISPHLNLINAYNMDSAFIK